MKVYPALKVFGVEPEPWTVERFRALLSPDRRDRFDVWVDRRQEEALTLARAFEGRYRLEPVQAVRLAYHELTTPPRRQEGLYSLAKIRSRPSAASPRPRLAAL